MILILPRRRLFFIATAVVLITLAFYYNPLSHHRHEVPISHSNWQSELSSVDNQATSYVAEATPAELCAPYLWKPYNSLGGKRKIYDLFLMNDELDWLEIRLNTLSNQVDYFVIVESPRTFTGLDKPLHLKKNWDYFAPFHKQIIHHVLSDNLASTDAWEHEILQRNAMFDQVIPFLTGPQAIRPDDVLIISDIDEIPRPHTATLLRNCAFPRRLTLRSRFYYYSFQWLHRGVEWQHPQATYYTGPSTITPSHLRSGTCGPLLTRLGESADLWNAAWHCSSCFSHISTILNKLSSFSHSEFNKDKFRQKEGILRRVRNGLDLFDRWGQKYDRVERNTDVPRYALRTCSIATRRMRTLRTCRRWIWR